MPTYDKIGYVSKTFAGVDIDRHAMRSAVAANTGISEEEVLASIEELTDDNLMLAPPSLHGFSLSDKMWCTFISICALESVTNSPLL